MKYFSLLFKNKATISGVSIILIACFLFLPSAIISESQLTKIQGKIAYSSAYVEDIVNKKGITETKSKRSSLEFKLTGSPQIFYLRENLGSINTYNSDIPHYNLNEALKNTKTATVWFRKSFLSEGKPEIFRLDLDGKTEIHLQDVRLKSQNLLIFMSIIGLILLALGLAINPSKNINR